MSAVTVAILSIEGTRDAMLAHLLRQWRAAGYEPLVRMQPADHPRGPAVHARAMRWAFAAALDCQPEGVLLCEDDIALAPDIGAAVQTPARTPHAATLYLPGLQFYGAAQRNWLMSGRRAHPGMFPVSNMRRWFGSQCVYLPAPLARRFVAAARSGGPLHGGDVVLRDWLLDEGERLYYVSPNPVQHLAPKSVTSNRYQPHTSRSYAW